MNENIKTPQGVSPETIKKYLGDTDFRFDIREQADSTNRIAKLAAQKGEPSGLVVIAGEQTAGRGRFDRSFFSPPGTGLYLSVLLRPDCPVSDSVLLTAAAAVSVALAVEKVRGGIVGIKWVNDIIADGKKVCGILTEAGVSVGGDRLDYAVVGIGINLFRPFGGFPEDIKNRAGAVFDKREPEAAERITAELLTNLGRYASNLSSRAFIDEYRRRLFIKNKRIIVHAPDGDYGATALDSDGECRLLIKRDDGREEYLCSGEISVTAES